MLAAVDPRVRVYDTVRMAQYADDRTAAAQICYLDDLFSDRYDRMLEAAARFGDVDINPLGNFAEHIPRRLRPLADNRLGQSLLLRAERKLVRRSENRTARRFRRCLLVNAEEAATLRTRTALPATRVTAVPPLLATRPGAVRRFGGQPEFVFLGLLSLPHNDDGLRWFLEAVWPLVSAALPDARLRVIGREIRPGLRALAESLAPRVRVEGYVADLGEALGGAAALINPLRFGSGVKLKVIEALSRQLPVISTSIGAEGIASGPGTGVLVADDPGGLAGLLRESTEPERNGTLSDEAGKHFDRVYARLAVFAAYDVAFG